MGFWHFQDKTTLLVPPNLGNTSRSDNSHVLESHNGKDVFLEEFLSKCGIYPKDRFYKPKMTTTLTEGEYSNIAMGAAANCKYVTICYVFQALKGM